MSFTKTALVAAGLSMALLTGAAAQNLEAWDIRDRTAYVVMMDGSMKSVRLGDKSMAMLMKGAKKVPRGTVLIMSGGDLYMVRAPKMFDKAGMPSFGAIEVPDEELWTIVAFVKKLPTVSEGDFKAWTAPR